MLWPQVLTVLALVLSFCRVLKVAKEWRPRGAGFPSLFVSSSSFVLVSVSIIFVIIGRSAACVTYHLSLRGAAYLEVALESSCCLRVIVAD